MWPQQIPLRCRSATGHTVQQLEPSFFLGSAYGA